MYFAEFIIGSFVGISLTTFLLMIVILLAINKGKARILAENTADETANEDYSVMRTEGGAADGDCLTAAVKSAFITRREIVDEVKSSENLDITVVERPFLPQLPTSLRYKKKTFAMLYATDKGVLMIVKLDDNYAHELAYKYPGIRRAHFPQAPNWYHIPVEDAFTDKEEIYRILFEACSFIDDKL